MFKLLQQLIAFKYACKLNHWQTDSYAKHLLFDRLQEDIDELVDDIAERYFMSQAHKSELNAELLSSESIELNLVKMAQDIMQEATDLAADDNPIISGLADNIISAFAGKLALLTLK